MVSQITKHPRDLIALVTLTEGCGEFVRSVRADGAPHSPPQPEYDAP